MKLAPFSSDSAENRFVVISDCGFADGFGSRGVNENVLEFLPRIISARMWWRIVQSLGRETTMLISDRVVTWRIQRGVVGSVRQLVQLEGMPRRKPGRFRGRHWPASRGSLKCGNPANRRVIESTGVCSATEDVRSTTN